MHSLNFAKKLKFIDKIIFTSDSGKYLDKVKNFKKLIKHKRSLKASKDNSMEEHIIRDLKNFFLINNIVLPDALLWLRPTHLLRSISTFIKAHKIFANSKKALI